MKMHYFDLKNWPILSSLEHNFVSKIHMVMVYGNFGNAALIILKNKTVYALGATTDTDSSLESVNVQKSILSLRELEVLSQKDIQTFAFGSEHVLALTENGEVYSWGNNTYGQLGQQSTCKSYPTLVEIPFTNDGMQNVVDIACGSLHSLIVTKEGKVFAWGQSNCGQVADNSHYKTPTQITVDKKMIVQVACGHSFNMVLTDNGEVYGWGDNSVGQMGKDTSANQDNYRYAGEQIRSKNTQKFPLKINLLLGIVIVKVVCGFNHVLALTDEGKLYAWGGNNYGQLGIGNKINTFKPCMVTHEMGRVSDIAALNCSEISVAVGETKLVYAWGRCLSGNILKPTLTPFSTMHDVFACFASSRVMHKPLILQDESSIFKCLWKAFDNESTSDLAIKVENKLIHVHKTILKMRCLYYETMFQDTSNWVETNQNVVECTDLSYTVVKAFLKYLYTDVIDLPPDEIVELMKLAIRYCEDDLKRRCVVLIIQQINVANVMYLYKTAIDHNVKELEEFCLSFASKHLTAVMQSGEVFKNLNEITLIERFMEQMSLAGAFKT